MGDCNPKFFLLSSLFAPEDWQFKRATHQVGTGPLQRALDVFFSWRMALTWFSKGFRRAKFWAKFPFWRGAKFLANFREKLHDEVLQGHPVYEQSRSYLAFFLALPASIWGHSSQTLAFTVTWWHPRMPKIANFMCAEGHLFSPGRESPYQTRGKRAEDRREVEG